MVFGPFRSLGAAPVPLHGPAFDRKGAYYVTVSIVRVHKNMWGHVWLVGRLRNRSHLSMATAAPSTRDPRGHDDLTAGVSLCSGRQMRVESVFAFCFLSFGFFLTGAAGAEK